MTLSRHVDRMEAAGLVERRPDPHDRRARQLFTTEKSRELLQPMRARAAAVYEQVLAGHVRGRARTALHAALETIIANLSAAETAPRNRPADRRPVGKEIRMTAQPTSKPLEEVTPLAGRGGGAGGGRARAGRPGEAARGRRGS